MPRNLDSSDDSAVIEERTVRLLFARLNPANKIVVRGGRPYPENEAKRYSSLPWDTDNAHCSLIQRHLVRLGKSIDHGFTKEALVAGLLSVLARSCSEIDNEDLYAIVTDFTKYPVGYGSSDRSLIWDPFYTMRDQPIPEGYHLDWDIVHSRLGVYCVQRDLSQDNWRQNPSHYHYAVSRWGMIGTEDMERPREISGENMRDLAITMLAHSFSQRTSKEQSTSQKGIAKLANPLVLGQSASWGDLNLSPKKWGWISLFQCGAPRPVGDISTKVKWSEDQRIVTKVVRTSQAYTYSCASADAPLEQVFLVAYGQEGVMPSAAGMGFIHCDLNGTCAVDRKFDWLWRG